MADTTIRVRPSPDGGFDLVCATCGRSSRLHPQESVMAQVRIALEQHRHDQPRDEDQE